MKELSKLEEYLVDINDPENIPQEVMKKFWEIKDELGSTPLGISHLDNDWYIVCPAYDNYIVWKQESSL